MSRKLVINKVRENQNTFFKASKDIYYALLDEKPFLVDKYGTSDYIGVDLQTGALAKLRETKKVGMYEDVCNMIMGELAHTSFRSHYIWGKHWLVTKWIEGRPLTIKVSQSDVLIE